MCSEKLVLVPQSLRIPAGAVTHRQRIGNHVSDKNRNAPFIIAAHSSGVRTESSFQRAEDERVVESLTLPQRSVHLPPDERNVDYPVCALFRVSRRNRFLPV
jgi:hypothetical protein